MSMRLQLLRSHYRTLLLEGLNRQFSPSSKHMNYHPNAAIELHLEWIFRTPLSQALSV